MRINTGMGGPHHHHHGGWGGNWGWYSYPWVSNVPAVEYISTPAVPNWAIYTGLGLLALILLRER